MRFAFSINNICDLLSNGHINYILLSDFMYVFCVWYCHVMKIVLIFNWINCFLYPNYEIIIFTLQFKHYVQRLPIFFMTFFYGSHYILDIILFLTFIHQENKSFWLTEANSMNFNFPMPFCPNLLLVTS
jgi:hypothetical protein